MCLSAAATHFNNPIACFITSIPLMLSIFRTKPLDQALSAEKYEALMKKS